MVINSDSRNDIIVLIVILGVGVTSGIFIWNFSTAILGIAHHTENVMNQTATSLVSNISALNQNQITSSTRLVDSINNLIDMSHENIANVSQQMHEQNKLMNTQNALHGSLLHKMDKLLNALDIQNTEMGIVATNNVTTK